MKERPILFNSEMIRAILDGRKTQTRRIMKPQPTDPPQGTYWGQLVHGDDVGLISKATGLYYLRPGAAISEDDEIHKCPFGQVGDHLWVRETFADTAGMGFVERIYYAADTRPGSDGDEARKAYGVKWKPSIHMPRWASRITLEITGIRVERLHEISIGDLWAESFRDPGGLQEFKSYWKDWDANPLVWVIEFKKV